MFLGDAHAAPIIGKGKVLLKLTSGKSIALTNMLHVPSMKRNLISSGLLNKASIKLVFDNDKLILTKNGNFVGKGFSCRGLFVLDATCNVMNKASSSTYFVDSLDIWHAKLDM